MARIRTQAVRRVEQRKGPHPQMSRDPQLDSPVDPARHPPPHDGKSAPRAGRSGGTGARAERPSEGGSEYSEEARRSENSRTKAPSPSS